MIKVLVLMSLISQLGHAETLYIVNGKQATKLEAVKALISNPNAEVLKSCPVELTSKLALKCRKSTQRSNN